MTSPHAVHNPVLTYSIEQLPSTAILQEDVVDGPLAPVPIEAHYVGVGQHLVHTHLFLHIVHTVLGSGHVHNLHGHRLLRLPVDQQAYPERQRSKGKMRTLMGYSRAGLRDGCFDRYSLSISAFSQRLHQIPVLNKRHGHDLRAQGQFITIQWITLLTLT